MSFNACQRGPGGNAPGVARARARVRTPVEKQLRFHRKNFEQLLATNTKCRERGRVVCLFLQQTLAGRITYPFFLLNTSSLSFSEGAELEEGNQKSGLEEPGTEKKRPRSLSGLEDPGRKLKKELQLFPNPNFRFARKFE